MRKVTVCLYILRMLLKNKIFPEPKEVVKMGSGLAIPLSGIIIPRVLGARPDPEAYQLLEVIRIIYINLFVMLYRQHITKLVKNSLWINDKIYNFEYYVEI